METYVVYWAYKAGMTDITTQGYVGISKDFDGRRYAHKKAANGDKPGAFYCWIRKHGFDAVQWDILAEDVSLDEALSLERELRPKHSIGWNNQRGGEIGVEPEWYDDPENAEAHSAATSEATKRAIAEKDTTEARSARAKEIWDRPEYRAMQSENNSGENNNCFGLYGENHPAFGHRHTDEVKARIGAAHAGEKAGTSKISDAERREICQRYANGESYGEIAKDFPITDGAVSFNVKHWGPKNGFPFLPPGLRTCVKIWEPPKMRFKAGYGELPVGGCGYEVSDEQKAEICMRRLAGESYKSIAEDFPYGLTGIRAVCMTWGPRNGFEHKPALWAKRT